MREVAALAGVSLKTVSRVVSGSGGVSDDLARRVEEAAQALGYRPNLTASSLRRSNGMTQSIGLLLDDVSNPFSSALHRAIEDVARERDVVVFAGSLDSNMDREHDLAEAFIARRVDGLILVPTSTDQSYLAAEQARGMVVVCVDRPPKFLKADVVRSDNRSGAHAAVSHLISHGHRRIAFLGDVSTISTATERRDGYLDVLAEVGIPRDQSLIRMDIRSCEEAACAVMELLASEDPPTGIFASQNLLTIGAIDALRRLGKQHSVALVGFDELAMREFLDPGLTIVKQDVAAIGRRAAELMFSRLDGSSPDVEDIIFPTTLIPGGSGEIPVYG